MTPYDKVFYPIFGTASLIAVITSILAARRSGRCSRWLLMMFGWMRAALILPVVDVLLLLAVIAGLPFAWVLRDGLGPDSVTTTGLAAFSRTLAVYFVGPVILLLAALNLVLRSRIANSKVGRSSLAIPTAIFLALLAISFGLSDWASLAIGIFSVAIGPMLVIQNPKPSHRLTTIATTILPLVSLILFYSLAIHMHQSLDGWPDRIGMNGFSSSLTVHANVAYFAFGSIFFGCLFVWPVALLLCAAAPKLRPGLPYLEIYAVTCLVAFAVSQMAPDDFLYWWWD